MVLSNSYTVSSETCWSAGLWSVDCKLVTKCSGEAYNTPIL